MKIITFYAKNVKRLTAVEITPDGALIQITGRNASGKTSVLDSIWWALGGAKNIQGEPIRKGEKSAIIKISLGAKDPELLVERRFTEKGEYLFVRNPDGSAKKDPQGILNGLVGAMTFEPLSFMRQKPGEQLATLRSLVALDVDIDALDKIRTAKFEERTNVNRRAREAQARADAITVPADLPEELPDVAALTARLADADGHNAEVRRQQREVDDSREAWNRAVQAVGDAEALLERAKDALTAATTARDALTAKEVPALIDTAAALAEIQQAQSLARAAQQRDDKINAEAEAATHKAEADTLTADIEKIDADKSGALERAEMPVPGLGFGDGAVIYNGIPLDQASDAEQLRVSCAIAAAANPKLRIIRVRDGSLLDDDGLKTLAAFAEEHDFQIWLERVDSSGEVGVVMEDGHVKGQELPDEGDEEAEPGTAPTETVADPAAEARAKAYIAGEVAKLPEQRERLEIEKMNATVKTKCARFPKLVSTEWNPAYLEALKNLKPKKDR